MDRGWLITIALSALVMFVFFRRARRLFGRQEYSVPRLCVRIGLFGTLGAMFGIVALIGGRGVGPWAWLAVGIAIGFLGIYLTRFESVEGQIFYTPNVYVGAVMLSLFIGRMIYKLTMVRAVNDPFSAFQDSQGSSPTSGILFAVVGYFVSYYLAVLLRGQRGQVRPDP